MTCLQAHWSHGLTADSHYYHDISYGSHISSVRTSASCLSRLSRSSDGHNVTNHMPTVRHLKV